MPTAAHVSPDEIRKGFSKAMSDMYRDEVPLYGALMALVAETNSRVLASDSSLARQLQRTGEIDRLDMERHGAIRLGTAAELTTISRLFAVMGMQPVGYYDLTPAGVPVHSTAFRAVHERSLQTSPFRVFTSLLRLELIENPELRAFVEARFPHMTFAEIEAAVAANFPPDRRTSLSAIHRWWHRMQRDDA